MSDLKKYDYKRLTPFKWFVLENFPFIEADFDAITNYQLYCKVVEYLNKTINSMNQTGEAVEEFTQKFIDLQNYVDNYFNNLDVQEEINNKLDDMVEQGTFTEIITQFINSNALWCYENVSALQNATNLINNSFAKTLGFYEKTDNGGAIYYITNDESITANGKDILDLKNGMKAVLKANSKYNICQFGAKGDNLTDNTTLLNYILGTYAKDGDVIEVPNGIYNISNSITCDKIITLRGEKSSPFRSTGARRGTTFKNNGFGGFIFTAPSPSSVFIENIDFIGNGSNTNCFGVNIKTGGLKIENCTFGHFNNIGLYLGNETEYLNLNDYYIKNVICYQCDIGCKIINPIKGSLTTPNANASTVSNLTCQSSRIGLYLENGTMNNFLSLHLENNTEYGLYLKNMYHNMFLNPYFENSSHNIYFDDNSYGNIILGTNRPVYFSSMSGNVSENFILSNMQSKGIRNIFNNLKTQDFKIAKEGVNGYWDFNHEDIRKLHILFGGSSSNSTIDLSGTDYTQDTILDTLKINKNSNTKITNMSTRLSTLSSKTIQAGSVNAFTLSFDAITNDNSHLKYWNTNISFDTEIDDNLIVTTHPASSGIKVKIFNPTNTDITIPTTNYCLFAYKQYN